MFFYGVQLVYSNNFRIRCQENHSIARPFSSLHILALWFEQKPSNKTRTVHLHVNIVHVKPRSTLKKQKKNLNINFETFIKISCFNFFLRKIVSKAW